MKTDEEFTSALSELQSLYETVESLRKEIENDSEFDEVSRPMLERVDALQESCSRYVDENIEINEEE